MDAQYKIIGGDGQEYGPATLEELKSWIRDGRVAGSTQVWRDDLDIWSTAIDLAELQPEIGRVPMTVGTVVEILDPPAGFWARLGAYLVDSIILAVLFSLFWEPLARMMGYPAQFNFKTTDEMFGFLQKIAPIIMLAQMVYDVLLNGSFGATLGKMAVGAQIVRVDGSRLGYGLAFLRWVATRVNEFMFGIGFLLILIRHDKRGLHDLMVGTKVIFRR